MKKFNINGFDISVREIQKEDILQDDGSFKTIHLMRTFFRKDKKNHYIPIIGTEGELLLCTKVLEDVLSFIENGAGTRRRKVNKFKPGDFFIDSSGMKHTYCKFVKA